MPNTQMDYPFFAIDLVAINKIIAICFLLAWTMLLLQKKVPIINRLKYRYILVFSLLCFLTYHVLSLIALGTTPIFRRNNLTVLLETVQLFGMLSMILFSVLHARRRVRFC